MRVSLIVTTYNRPDALKLVLESALRQSRMPDEIIVADDGSKHETYSVVSDFKKKSALPLHHVWQEDQGFRAAAIRNAAIRKATGEYLILIDGDMILHREFVEDHIRCCETGVFIQGGRVLIAKQQTEEMLHTAYNVPGFFSSGLNNRKNAIHAPVLCQIFARRTKRLGGVRTCNFSLFKADAYRVNGFDEAFVGWGREDSEFAARLLNAGIERKDIRFAAIAFHLYHEEASRQALPENDRILQCTIADQKTWCQKGLA